MGLNEFKGWKEKLPEYWLCERENSKEWKLVVEYLNTVSPNWEGSSFDYYGIIELGGDWRGVMGTDYSKQYPEATVLTVKQFMEMVKEETFERGEWVEVSEDKESWYKRIYLTTIEESKYPYLCVIDVYEESFIMGRKILPKGYLYIRKLQPKMEIEVTLNGEKVNPSTLSKETWEKLRSD